MRSAVAVALAVVLVAPASGFGTAGGLGSAGEPGTTGAPGAADRPGTAREDGLADHGNSIEVDTQVSADGTVLVERVLMVVDGFLVVHRDGEGGPGEVIGHTQLSSESYTSRSVRVPVDGAAWAEWGDSRTVWVVIHRDEGGPGFDPGEDPMERSFGTVTGERIQLGKGDAESSVVAADFSVQRTDADAVTVRRVALGRDGRVAVRTDGNGGGRVLGSTALDAGVHRNVSVGIDGSVFASRGRRLTLVAELHSREGSTGDGDDRPLRVGGEPIRTEFVVERTGPIEGIETGERTTKRGEGSGTPVDDPAPDILTPSPTPTPPAVTPAVTSEPGEDDTPAGASGPGFDWPAAAVAVLGSVGAFLAARYWTRRE